MIHLSLVIMSIIHYPSQTSLPASYTAPSIFEDPNSLPPPNSPRRNGLPQTAIIVLLTTIPIIFSLAIIFEIVHMVRRRNLRILQARKQADVERSLTRTRGVYGEKNSGLSKPMPSKMVARDERPQIPSAQRMDGGVRGGE